MSAGVRRNEKVEAAIVYIFTIPGHILGIL